MERRKDILDIILKQENISVWFIGIVIGVAAFLFILLLPYFLIGTDEGWKKFNAISSFAYTVITLATFFAIAVTANLAIRQLKLLSSQIKENERTRKLAFVLEMRKQYATEEMYLALRTLYNCPPEMIYVDNELNNQRRRVSQFWHMIAWTVYEGLVDLDSVISSFVDGVYVYEKLKDVEILIQKEIISRDPELSEQEVEQRAKHAIEVQWLLARLYQDWKKREQEKGLSVLYPFPPTPTS